MKHFALNDQEGNRNPMPCTWSNEQAIRNGTDMMLVNYPTATNNMAFTDTNAARQALRQAVHRVLYIVVNSREFTPEHFAASNATPFYKLALQGMWICGGILLALWAVLLVRGFVKKTRKAKKA